MNKDEKEAANSEPLFEIDRGDKSLKLTRVVRVNHYKLFPFYVSEKGLKLNTQEFHLNKMI